MPQTHAKLKAELASFQHAKAATVLKTGVKPDLLLLDELKFPGSDKRCGINVMARPPAEVKEHIFLLQDYLKAYDPKQYFYPEPDLHMTVLEVSFDRTWEESRAQAEQVLPWINNIFGDLSPPMMDVWGLIADQHGCALNFLPRDGALNTLRQTVAERLSANGLVPSSRYQAQFGHLTMLRYLTQVTEPKIWMDKVINAPVNKGLSWCIEEVYLTWGADWYGMRSRNEQGGPFRLGSQTTIVGGR